MKSSELEHPSAENGVVSLNDRVRSLRLSQQPTAKPRTRILPWALCVILLLTTSAFGYRAYRVGVLVPTSAAPSASDNAVAPTTALTSASNGASVGEVVLQSKGYVIPAHQVQVSPKVGGMILKLNERFEEGQFFKEGEVLAWLEKDDYQADYDHALAVRDTAEQRYWESLSSRPEEIEASLNELQESQATFEQLDRDLRRSERLIGGAALSVKEFEQAKFTRDAMKRRVERLRSAHKLMELGPRKERQKAALADWEAAQADVDRAEWRLSNCEIKAPIAGHILVKTAEKGAVINPLALKISGSLCDMANLGDLEIDLSIQERDIARVKRHQFCTIMPEAFQNDEPFRKQHPRGYQGHVIRLMPIANRSKGAINVRVKVENIPDNEIGKILKPEMSVLVSFYKGSE